MTDKKTMTTAEQLKEIEDYRNDFLYVKEIETLKAERVKLQEYEYLYGMNMQAKVNRLINENKTLITVSKMLRQENKYLMLCLTTLEEESKK